MEKKRILSQLTEAMLIALLLGMIIIGFGLGRWWYGGMKDEINQKLDKITSQLDTINSLITKKLETDKQIKQAAKQLIKDPDKIRELGDNMDMEPVRERIANITDIPTEDIPPDTDLKEYAVRLIEISQNKVLAEETEQLLPVSFSIEVKSDNSPQNPQTNFVALDKRIYACFSNQGELKGLKRIVARWTNSADGSIVYIGAKTINPGVSWNYVWLEKKKGWAKGTYSVELLRTDTLKRVAQGTFEIK